MSELVGIVGLGHIGLAIATRLVVAGRTPIGYRRGDPAAFVERGGMAAPSVEQLCDMSDYIFLVLPNIDTSNMIIDSIIGRAFGSKTIIDVTSQPPHNAKANAERLEAAGHTYIESPVSGAPQVVEDGNGQFLVGADASAFERVQSLLEELASTVTHVGQIGSASALKSAALLMMTINILGAAEGLAYAVSYGVDPFKAVEALQNGPAASAALRHRGPWMAAGDFAAKLGRMADFQNLLHGIADSASTSTQLFGQALAYVDQGIGAGLGDQDIAGLYAPISKIAATPASRRGVRP